MTTFHNMIFRYDDDLRLAMEALKERDGIPFQEQLRRAMRAWLETKGLGPVLVPQSARQTALIERAQRLMQDVQRTATNGDES